jgi:hypothetical protein
MDKIKELEKKLAALNITGDLKEHVANLNHTMVRIACANAVLGSIPNGLLDALDSALSILTPLCAILGDWELTTLLSALKVWGQKKRSENAMADAQQQSMQGSGYSSFWN